VRPSSRPTSDRRNPASCAPVAAPYRPGRSSSDGETRPYVTAPSFVLLEVRRGERGNLFGPVASEATTWRVLDGVDEAVLARVRTARARARELAWARGGPPGRR
jgi:hypothetical protein